MPNGVLMDRSLYLWFAVLELSKIQLCESNYDNLQPYLRKRNIQFHFMDTDSFVLSVKTKIIFENLKNLIGLFHLGTLSENHELISKINRKVIGNFKIYFLESFWIDEFICLGSRDNSFKCDSDNENKIKSVSNLKQKHLNLKNVKFV